MTVQHVTSQIVPPQFGRYRFVREIGRGGMGAVYEAIHEDLGRPVALKLMHSPFAQPVTIARFLREGRLAAQIRHPNVVDVFDIGLEGGVPFIVMELLKGETLAGHLARCAPLSARAIAELMLPIMSAVAAAHEMGVVHRDLKPGNIILARRGRRLSPPQPVVLDFGISKTADDDDAPLTRSGSILGTVHYMSPEQTRGAKFATPLSDQYALGVMLYECATGALPFQGNGAYQLMHAIVTAPVCPPSAINPAVGTEFDAIVLRAMDRNPDKRFPSVEALGSALLSLGGKSSWIIWGREFIADRNGSGSPGETQGDDGPNTDTLESAVHGSRAAKVPVRRLGRPLYAVLAGTAIVALFVALVARVHLRGPAIPDETGAVVSLQEAHADPGAIHAADPTTAATSAPAPSGTINEAAATTSFGGLGENATASPAGKGKSGSRRAAVAGTRADSNLNTSVKASSARERGEPSHDPETGSNNAPILE